MDYNRQEMKVSKIPRTVITNDETKQEMYERIGMKGDIFIYLHI